MTSLQVLGSGTGVPAARRSPPGLLIREDSGSFVLIDPGPGALHRAVCQGAAVASIRTVFLTHLHPDHTIDLISLLFARHSVLLKPELERLVLAGPAGTKEFYRKIVELYGRWVKAPEEDLQIEELGVGALPPATGMTGAAFHLPHLVDSLGYRFEYPDGVAAVSGDTGPSETLIELGRTADLFLLECSVPDAYKGTPGHLCPAEAGEAAAAAMPRRLVLYHLYPPVDAQAALDAVAQRFDGPCTVAEDGDRFDLKGGKA